MVLIKDLKNQETPAQCVEISDVEEVPLIVRSWSFILVHYHYPYRSQHHWVSIYMLLPNIDFFQLIN